jgi:hypothetical protein
VTQVDQPNERTEREGERYPCLTYQDLLNVVVLPVMETKQFIKGYIIDYDLVAKAANIDASDLNVHHYTRVIMSALNRDGYKFIGSVYRHVEPGKQPNEKDLALAIVLEIGEDEEALKKMELPPLDETIAACLPHVLVGPGVWELWD